MRRAVIQKFMNSNIHLQCMKSINSFLISIYFVGEINIAEGIEKARNDDMGCILYFGNGIGYYHEGELGKNPPEFLMLNEVNDKN